MRARRRRDRQWVEPLEPRCLLSLPAGFAGAEVGAPPAVGADGYAPDTFSASGAGIISGTSDSFHFLYGTLGFTGSIVARVATQQDAGSSGAIGVMMRDTLAASSRHVTCSINGAGVATLAHRDDAGGATITDPNSPSVGTSFWLRLVRDFSDFTAYTSADGVNWTQLAACSSGMGSSILVGLIVSSGSAVSSTPASATFDHVSIPTAISRTGSTVNDSFYVRLDPTGVNLQLWHQAVPESAPVLTVYRGNVAAATFHGGGLGNDSLTVDLTYGNPLPIAASFDGGTGGNDTLKFIAPSSGAAGTVTQTQFSIGGAVVNMPDCNGMQFTGGAGDDTLIVQSALSFFPAFNGGAGNDRLDINAGTMDFLIDPSATTANLTMTVANASVLFHVNQHLGALAINGGGVATMKVSTQYLQTGALSIAPTGRLDLNNADLIVQYNAVSPLTTVRQYVQSGYRTFQDASATGIVSTSAQQGAGQKILALFDNALQNVSVWPTGSGNTVPANAVIGHHTYFGDVNFDNRVTGDDYTVVDSNLNTTPPAGLAWLKGDANVDGSVTGDDYTTVDAHLGLGSGGPMAPAALKPTERAGDLLGAI